MRLDTKEPKFEWDDDKRKINIEKHGIDFVRAALIFAEPYKLMDAKSDVEMRHRAIGLLNDMLITVVFTCRGDKIRLISARRARDDESRAYHTVVTG